ncbi:MAG: RNA polymerase sigma factor [Bacteroidales bacterium]|nr:RNA polymerase sigma factor [Bacteroidales bacterium]
MNEEIKKQWEQVYKEYSKKMYGICLRYARNANDAKDILHDGFVKAFLCLKDYKGIGSFEGWLRRIFVTTAINFYHKFINRSFLEEPDVNIPDEEKDELISFEDMQLEDILREINSLPDGYRMVFNMFVIEGYSHKEIAQILNISESTSKTQLFKARRLLMKNLNKNLDKCKIKSYEKL